MAKREWVGEYWLNLEIFLSYKNVWVREEVNLGKCLGNDEACDKAIWVLLRDYVGSSVRDVYILDGWGHLIYM